MEMERSKKLSVMRGITPEINEIAVRMPSDHASTRQEAVTVDVLRV